MKNELIEFSGVKKSLNGSTVLDGVDLKIYEGDITTVIGKSGTGKSVLLKHIIGLLHPDEGTIYFRGSSVNSMGNAEWDNYRTHVSYMFQNNALFDSMTVFDNVALPLCQTSNLSRKEIEKKVTARLEQTEILDAIDKYPSELSGGMQKRVALARALVTDPEVVLFDEPTTGQDPIRKNAILSMIAQYKKKIGFTAVLISHDIPDVFFISDRIVLLWDGRVAFQGTYEESLKLDHPMIDEFLQSLEGFQDALTGLLSKQAFRARYETMLRKRHPEKEVMALVVNVEHESLCELVGHESAIRVVKTLGEYIHKQIDFMEGFSTREKRDHLLTILPYMGKSEAQELLLRLQESLPAEVLCDLHEADPSKDDEDGCVEITVNAGIAEVLPNDDIDEIIERATEDQHVIAKQFCRLRR
jgi:phospholipid/cholesterol/gamma-HCH transport system ATP-binding protein